MICVSTLVVLALTPACTGRDASPVPAVPPAVPSEDAAAIRTTVERFNAAAATSVAEQQAALSRLIDPGSAAAQQKCRTPTSTLRFEPVYQALRAAPDWTPADGTLAGTVYALPSLIRVYTGDRVTGTDLTTVHLGVRNGEAFLTAICVG